MATEPSIHTEWRTWEETPEGGRWGWTTEEHKAFVFDHYGTETGGRDNKDCALIHANELKATGMRFVVHVTRGRGTGPVRTALQMRERDRILAATGSIRAANESDLSEESLSAFEEKSGIRERTPAPTPPAPRPRRKKPLPGERRKFKHLSPEEAYRYLQDTRPELS